MKIKNTNEKKNSNNLKINHKYMKKKTLQLNKKDVAHIQTWKFSEINSIYIFNPLHQSLKKLLHN